MEKRAQGLPVNVMIIVAIGVIIFIVLALLIGKNILSFGKTTTGCTQKGGVCVKTAAECSAKNGMVIDAACSDDKPYCCLTREAYA